MRIKKKKHPENVKKRALTAERRRLHLLKVSSVSSSPRPSPTVTPGIPFSPFIAWKTVERRWCVTGVGRQCTRGSRLNSPLRHPARQTSLFLEKLIKHTGFAWNVPFPLRFLSTILLLYFWWNFAIDYSCYLHPVKTIPWFKQLKYSGNVSCSGLSLWGSFWLNPKFEQTL